MSTISLPNNDNGSEVSDDLQKIYIVVRLTPDGAYTQDDLKKFLTENVAFTEWVVGVEVLPKVHYHLVISTHFEFDTIHEIIKEQVHKWYPPPRARGFGNKQWNCQLGKETLERGISYALKDKVEHFYEGFEADFIEYCLEASFPKNSTSNFKLEYLELCEEFQNSDMDIEAFMIKYSILKSKYGQQVKMQDALGYANSNLIRRNPDEAKIMVKNFLYKM